MSEINIPKENEGFIYTILSFERNVEIKCNKNCRYIKEKKILSRLSSPVNDGKWQN